MSTRSKIVAGVALVIVVAAGAWFLKGKKETTTPPFLTAAVERGRVTQTVATTGTLTAVTTVKVGSQVSGIIASLHADFNDRVSRHQVVATLDPTPFEAQVNQTRAQLQRTRIAALDAESKFKRQQALYAAQLTSLDQLDSARATLDQALAQVTELEASLERAETNLRYSIIRSPIDGVVVSRDYDVGQTVAASFQAPTLFTIAEDLTRMQLTCDVDEADIGQVKVGQTVRFSVDTFPEREFQGTVSQIRLSPKTSSNVVTYPVIVEVDNGELSLLPGMTADVRVQVAQADGVLRVPSSALRFRPEMLGLQTVESRQPVQGGRTGQGRPPGGAAGRPDGEQGGGRSARVYLAPEGGGQALRPVTFLPGLTDGQFVEVRGGELGEGATIVVGLATSSGKDAGGLATMMGPRGRRR
ncbi:MAG: efflux RND transporter periplasmic adaptor subunit [Acidobacteriota bacterium]